VTGSDPQQQLENKDFSMTMSQRQGQGLTSLPNNKCRNWNPKTHFFTWNDVFWRILRKNPFRGALLKNPQKRT